MKHSTTSLFAGVFISTILLLSSAANASNPQPGLPKAFKPSDGRDATIMKKPLQLSARDHYKVRKSPQSNVGAGRIIKKNVQQKKRVSKRSATMIFKGSSTGKTFLMTSKGEKCYITLHMNKIIIQVKRFGRGWHLGPQYKTYLANNESKHVMSFTTLGCLPYGNSTKGPIKASKQSLGGNIVTYTFKTPGYTIQIRGTIRIPSKGEITIKGTYQMRKGGYQGHGGIANHSGTWSAKRILTTVP